MADKICDTKKLSKQFQELKKSYVNFVTKNPAAVEQVGYLSLQMPEYVKDQLKGYHIAIFMQVILTM